MSQQNIEFDEDPDEAYAPRRRQREPKRPTHRHLVEFAQGEQPGGIIKTTYQPARYEEVWLDDSLRSFYTGHFIVDVLAQVKGGKEATVYRCAAHPRLATPWLAAKVYRPRMFRNLRNDQMYQQGRPLITGDGHVMHKTDQRMMRAVQKKTTYGAQVTHTSWLMYEYTTMERLFQAGAAVPRPVAVADNAILMGYVGDGDRAAPALNEIALPTDEAPQLFDEVLRNIEVLLRHDLIHGDLSAYNILYWEGAITLIDFPQVTACQANDQAQFILQRDITRVCEYFARCGVVRDPVRIMRDLWANYVPGNDAPRPVTESG
jgi:RIO kinase 1